ncbi:hypothetical protein LTR50_001878 [Elasticomyces elasticus]|nr:hypothetical protein LTR50_001878 [Elasticomyces elasticus]
MPSIPLHPPPLAPLNPTPSPLPQLLHTPSGLAIIEIQGTINLTAPSSSSTDVAEAADADADADAETRTQTQTPVGRLVFPLYRHDAPEMDHGWTKRVYLYVGKHQRMTGEVKKLLRPLAVVGRREGGAGAVRSDWSGEVMQEEPGTGEELEIVEIVKWKILFANRPEPVGGERV